MGFQDRRVPSATYPQMVCEKSLGYGEPRKDIFPLKKLFQGFLLPRTLSNTLQPGEEMMAGECGAGNHIRKRNGGDWDSQRDGERCLQICTDSRG